MHPLFSGSTVRLVWLPLKKTIKTWETEQEKQQGRRNGEEKLNAEVGRGPEAVGGACFLGLHCSVDDSADQPVLGDLAAQAEGGD